MYRHMEALWGAIQWAVFVSTAIVLVVVLPDLTNVEYAVLGVAVGAVFAWFARP